MGGKLRNATLKGLLRGDCHGDVLGIVYRPQAAVLVAPHVVIGQQVDAQEGSVTVLAGRSPTLLFQAGKKLCRGLDVGLVGIDALYEWDTYKEGRTDVADKFYIVYYLRVTYSCIKFMSVLVHHLQVDE